MMLSVWKWVWNILNSCYKAAKSWKCWSTTLLPSFCSSESESGSQSVCDQLVTPTALAACTRVDSCFTPWFVPSLSVLIQVTCLEVHLCHHLDQLGTGMFCCMENNKNIVHRCCLSTLLLCVVPISSFKQAFLKQAVTNSHQWHRLQGKSNDLCALSLSTGLAVRLEEQPLPAPGTGNCRSRLFSIVWLGTAGATSLLSHLSEWIWSFTFSSVLTVLLKYLKILQPA